MIGIVGGTFDPIHFGHLRPALEIYQDLGLDELRWIPSGQPPHRDAPSVSTEHRLNMLHLALQGMQQSVIDEREIQRQGPSYMVDTLSSLRADYTDKGLALILGMDAFNGLSTWHRWQELFELAHIIVCSRPGAELSVSGQLKDVVADRQVMTFSKMKQCTHGMIYIHAVTRLSISATRIRRICQQGKSPRFLLPDKVCDYIEKNGLYR
jgi:nicotinate-nucleotide adenylyltransferase